MSMEKYEKKPEDTWEKQPPIKNVLLQTYFTSLLCLLLCVTMFCGTSYAWFTNEVQNTGNEIYIGTLDVELKKQVGEEWKSLSEVSNGENTTKLFDGGIRWEPGYTALETISVINEGDLAFKYVLNFTDGTAKNADGSEAILADTAKYFDVWVYDHRANADKEGVKPTPDSYAALTAENSGWVSAGSLEELLAGQTVLGGTMDKVRGERTVAPANAGTTDGIATENTYTIALHMKEEATSIVMGQKITLNVKLVAYQMTYEKDGLNSRYDQMAATQQELKEAFANGGMVALAADIKLTESMMVKPDQTVILDLNGHKITGTASEKMLSLIANSGTLAIVGNGEISIALDAEISGVAVNAISNRGNLTVNGGKISNTGTGYQIGYGIDNYNGAALTVNGGEITAGGSNYFDGIRLFCGSSDTLVVINGGKVSTVWAQNPTTNEATEVKGTVIINGGEIGTIYFENYTTVRVANDVSTTVTAYGAGSEKATTVLEDGYTVYSFGQSNNG